MSLKLFSPHPAPQSLLAHLLGICSSGLWPDMALILQPVGRGSVDLERQNQERVGKKQGEIRGMER